MAYTVFDVFFVVDMAILNTFECLVLKIIEVLIVIEHFD